MENNYILKQLEFYSNTTISFVVLQGLVYCYNFATNDLFNSSVKCNSSLSISLVVMLFVTMLFCSVANLKIGKTIKSLCGSDNVYIVSKIYRSKLYIIVYFGMLPIVITFFFGFLGECVL